MSSGGVSVLRRPGVGQARGPKWGYSHLTARLRGLPEPQFPFGVWTCLGFCAERLRLCAGRRRAFCAGLAFGGAGRRRALCAGLV